MKIIQSDGGPLIGLDRDDLQLWKGSTVRGSLVVTCLLGLTTKLPDI